MNYKEYPKKSLGFFPTPVVELSRLSDILGGPRIFMKRDDLTGLALGGNKTRKLEYIMADALAMGADSIITAGAAQSNHCRQTAAAAAALGLECHLLLGGEEPSQIEGNILLNTLLGSHIHWAGANRKGEDIPKLQEDLVASGNRPYIVPYGGSNSLGAISFVHALDELHSQLPDQPFSRIIFASSSGGTQAGMMVGKKLLNKNYELTGINIDKGETDAVPFHDYILNLAKCTATMIGLDDDFSHQDLCLNSDYVGDGYAVIGSLEIEAIALTAKHEGILLDPVYTGRAMGGLIDMIRTGEITKQESVLFWHTGGAPALFAYSEKLLSEL